MKKIKSEIELEIWEPKAKLYSRQFQILERNQNLNKNVPGTDQSFFQVLLPEKRQTQHFYDFRKKLT